MWRAYGGGNSSVAFVFHPSTIFDESFDLDTESAPILYLDNSQAEISLASIANNLKKYEEFLRKVSRSDFMLWMFGSFALYALTLKHPGFKEEREWRVIYRPSYSRSPHIASAVETIAGIPQTVHKIPLQNIPGVANRGLSIPDLLERVIIGPCRYPSVVRDAYVSELRNAGVEDADERVVVSQIPLRV